MRVIIFLMTLFFATSTFAAGCYTANEFEAEQGLRIHSELMVIALNCQHVSHRDGNLYIQYKDFTRRHQNLIAQYEGTLKNYFVRTGESDPERKINDLRTAFANKISQDAAKMRPNAFCKVYSSRITQALGMDEPKLRRWAATPFPGFPVSRAVCTAG